MEQIYPTSVLIEIERVAKGFTKKIDFYHKGLKSLPPQLFQLLYLEELNLKKNQLSQLPKEIGNLKNLKHLILDDNKLSFIPEEISELTNLTYLSIRNNKLTFLPQKMIYLKSLQTINIADNEISSISDDFYKLENLEEIQLQGNKFTEIPAAIYNLKILKKFYFTSDPFKNIFSLSLNENKATEISNEICRLEKIQIFKVNPNDFQFPPPEVVSGDVNDIKKFFLQIEAEGEDYLFEAKLLIVGEPGAGKTTLSRKIIDINAALPEDSETTKGIAISKFEFSTEDNNHFHVNIWDFGGQEIYHSTHQFFLTKRSLYLLICDTRKEDTSYNYWLQVIELLSDSSPVIIIHNEKQDRNRDINLGAMRKRFLNLKDQVQRSNFATKRGLNEISNVIKYEIQKLPHVGDKLPKTWVRVRRAIEQIACNKNYISDEDFFIICEYNGIPEYDKARQLSNYLHDLGVFLHFKDGSILERTIILNNNWATEAVYKVLDYTKKDELKGRFQLSDLKEIWTDSEYQKKSGELLALMLKFELCYKIDNSTLYIVPQLLPINEPLYEWNLEKSLQFRYIYEFMPKGIIGKLIVRLHKYIQNQRLVWREGVVIERLSERALVKESYGKKEIQIFVTGIEPRIFLTIIVEELDKINADFPKIDFEKLIPCNCYKCKKLETPHFYKYSDLFRRIENNKIKVECPISYEEVIVKYLIENIFEPEFEKNARNRKIIRETKKVKNKIFISYSHKDMEWLNNLKRHFAPIINQVEFFDDSMISSGEMWKMKIENAIKESRIAILLLSADFFNSKFIIDNELPPILDSAENDGTVILGVVLKPCLIEDYPNISQYQFINGPTHTIIQMEEAERELTWIKLINEVKKYAINL